ncbi:DUF748 domain-containing protein [Marinobacter sp.]|uniref:DUF748 domain-containing protein n=1 Tax=Marinobacter sp. TaxID=50741 RepID=UPI00384C38FD
MAKPAAGKPVHKRWTFWLLLLLVLYALAGFILLPWWLERALPDRLEQHLGWSASVNQVTFNPFTMTLDLEGLAAEDRAGDRVLEFDRFHVDLGFLQLFRGVISLDVVELEGPFVRVDLLEDYDLNFARDWRASNPDDATADEPSSETEGDGPRLYFGRISLDNGDVLLRDFSQGEEERFQIESLDLTLNDLATFSRPEDSGYTLNAALGEQTLAWKGEMNISPFVSRGRLSIANIDHATVSHFAGRFLPWQLREGRLTIESDYVISMDGGLRLVTSNGQITVENLALATGAQEDPPAVQLDRLVVDSINYDFRGRSLAVGAVDFSGADVLVNRDSEGRINLVPSPATTKDENQGQKEDQGEAAEQPFRWSVETAKLQESNLRWRDAALATPAEITLSQLGLSVSGLSHELAEPVSYKASLAVADEGRMTAQGQLTMAPFTLEAGLSADNLALASFEPYLQEVAALDLRGGSLTLAGDLDLDGQTDPMTGTFNGAGEIAGMDASAIGSGEPLVAWQSLRLDPIEYNLAPARLEIGRVTLRDPSLVVERSENGALNLAAITKDGEDNDTATEDAETRDQQQEQDEAPGFIFRIGEVVLENGTLDYADFSVDPDFETRLDQLSGSVSGLSNVTPQEGRMNLTGRVAQAGDLKVEGTLGTLGSEATSNLKLTLKQLGLPVLSPYFAQFLGYGVDGGKLGLEMDYTFKGSRITATNHIVLDRLELGSAAPGGGGINAPIKLGLALLRDSDGRIDINLPVEGDLTDPDFQITRVVMGTFANLVIKAATSPFSVLGSVADLAGITGPELGNVGFRPGIAELGDDESRKLEALAEALAKRPQLALDVRGGAAPELDRPALLRQQLFDDLEIAPDGASEERARRLEQAYQAADLSPPLDRLRAQTESASGRTEKWQEALISKLIQDRSLPDNALRELASKRGQLLQSRLLETHGVPSEQLYMRSPALDAAVDDDQGLVRVPFELGTR